MIFEPSIIFVLAIIFFATLIRGTFGFGDALFAMPLLAMVIDLQTTTALVAMVAATMALLILADSWQSVRFQSAWRLIISSIIGIPIGLLFLKETHGGLVKLVLSLVLVLFAAYSLVRPRLPSLKNEKAVYFFGILAGILGGAYNATGPPVVIYGVLRRWSQESFRATLQGYFLATGLVILSAHGFAGFWTSSVLRLFLLSLPIVLATFFLGKQLQKKISQEKFVKLVYALLLVIGLLFMFQAARGILPKNY